jgi:predicted aspartyl protease
MFAPLIGFMLTASLPLAIGQQSLPGADPLVLPAPGTEMNVAAQQDPQSRMTVSVYLNEHGPFDFVVDTGANRTVISSALAARLGLPMGNRVRVHDIAGVGGAETALVERLRVGKRQIDNVVAPLLSATDMGADGILGIDGLVNQQVVMDFLDRKMTIAPARKIAGEADTIVVRARSRFGQLILADARIGNERVYVIVDSGAEYSVGNMALRDRLLRGRRKPAPIPIELVGVSGRTQTADLTVTPQMKIGNVVMKNVPIAFSDVHPFRQFGLEERPAMLLGMDLLRSFESVSLDFEQKKVRFRLKD